MGGITNNHVGYFILELLAPSSGAGTAFSAVSLTISTLILSVVTGYLIFQGGQWIWKTARTGLPGGREEQATASMAVMRMVLVTGLVVPLFDGFSGVHKFIREVGEASIFFADKAALALTEHLSTKGAMVPFEIPGGTKLTKDLLRLNMCMHARNHVESKFKGKPTTVVRPQWHVIEGSLILAFNFSPNSQAPKLPNSYCGNVSIDIGDNDVAEGFTISSGGKPVFSSSDLSPNEREAGALTVQRLRNLEQLNNSLGKLSFDLFKRILAVESESSGYRGNLYEGKLKSIDRFKLSLSEKTNFVSQIISARDSFTTTNRDNAARSVQHFRAIQTGVSDLDQVNTDFNLHLNADTESWDRQINEVGWMSVGFYSFALGRIHSLQQEFADLSVYNVNPPSHFTSVDVESSFLWSDKKIEKKDRDDVINHPVSKASDLLTSQVLDGLSQTRLEEPPGSLTALESMGDSNNGGFTAIKSWLNNLFPSLLKGMLNIFATPDGMLLANLHQFGNYLMIIAEVVGVVFVAQWMLKGTVAGTALSVATGGLWAKVVVIIGFAFLFLAILGVLFTYILPFTFIIMWVMACLTWVVNLCKLYILAPAWLASHGRVGESDLVHSSARQGWMLLASVLLRPSLLVATMAIVHLLYAVISILLSWTLSALIGLGSGVFIGPVASLFILIIMIFVTYQLLMRNHELLIHVPDHLIAIIGGGSSDGLNNESTTAGSTNTTILGVSRKVIPGGGGSGSSAPFLPSGGGAQGSGDGLPAPGGSTASSAAGAAAKAAGVTNPMKAALLARASASLPSKS